MLWMPLHAQLDEGVCWVGSTAPGKLHWFHLTHGLLFLAGHGEWVWLCGKKKEVCESTSAWNCHRGPWAAAVTQLLAAVLHVSARRTAGKLKGRTQCRAGHWPSLTKDFWNRTAAQSNGWKPVCCFPWATKGFFLIEITLLNFWLQI